MSIPYVFQAMRPQDVTQVPYKTYKRYYLDSNTLTDTSSGYRIWSAVHSNKPVPVSAPQAQNDPTNSFDGTYQHLVWNQVNAQYYRYPYDSTRTLEHANKRFTYKFLNYSASILTLPHLDFGEMIKPGSVEITCSNFILSDDKNGNLYDVSINTGSFAPRQNLVAYWGFNDAFRSFRYREGTISTGRLNYQSNVYEVDRESFVTNIRYETGSGNMGMSARFGSVTNQDSYIFTEHKDEFNFGEDEDFTISFWSRPNSFLAGTYPILNKCKIVEKTTYGNQQKYQNDLLISTTFESRSFIFDSTPIYPFRFDYYRPGTNRYLYFRRSDGINTIALSASLSTFEQNNWIHVGLVRENKHLYLYINGTLRNDITDNTNNTFNRHSLMFGGRDATGIGINDGFPTNLNERKYLGYLDEIRIYDIALTTSSIQTLANSGSQAMFQTAVCGNVFYRSGKVVVSGFNSKYHNTFNSGSWTMKYRGTHTIYQNEALVRIAPGDFNLSQNPTVRRSYKSDLLIDEMTTGSMMPYVTEIGFYNEKGDLLVIGKPNQAIQIRDDVVLNIITQWDI